MQLPHRAALRITRVGTTDPVGVGRHALDLLRHRRRILTQRNRVVIRLRHFLPIKPRHLRGFGQQITGLDENHLAGPFKVTKQTLAVGHREMRDFGQQRMAFRNGFLVALLLETGTQMLEGSLVFAAQLGHRFLGFFLETRLAPVHVIEATRQLAGKFHMRNLVLSDRHFIGTVNQNIGTHQQRIT